MPKSDLWYEYKGVTQQTWRKNREFKGIYWKKETYKKGIGYLQAKKGSFFLFQS